MHQPLYFPSVRGRGPGGRSFVRQKCRVSNGLQIAPHRARPPCRIMDGEEHGLPNDVANDIQEVKRCVQEDRAAMDSRSAASTCDSTGRRGVVHKPGNSWCCRRWCLSFVWCSCRRGKCSWINTSLRQSWFAQEVVHLTRLAVPNVLS